MQLLCPGGFPISVVWFFRGLEPLNRWLEPLEPGCGVKAPRNSGTVVSSCVGGFFCPLTPKISNYLL